MFAFMEFITNLLMCESDPPELLPFIQFYFFERVTDQLIATTITLRRYNALGRIHRTAIAIDLNSI